VEQNATHCVLSQGSMPGGGPGRGSVIYAKLVFWRPQASSALSERPFTRARPCPGQHHARTRSASTGTALIAQITSHNHAWSGCEWRQQQQIMRAHQMARAGARQREQRASDPLHPHPRWADALKTPRQWRLAHRARPVQVMAAKMRPLIAADQCTSGHNSHGRSSHAKEHAIHLHLQLGVG
jgi:hypothetical protein